MPEPDFSATAEGFHDALGRAGRRRRRRHAITAGASGGALALVVAVVLAAGTGLSGTDGLEQVPTYPGAPEPEASVDRDDPAEATPEPTAGAGTPSAGPVVRGSGAGQPATAPAAPGASSPTPPSGIEESPVPISSPARLTTTAYRHNQPCADISGRQAGGWCGQVDGDFTSRAGTANDLSVSLCRLPGFGPATASFPSTAEAGFQLLTGSGEPQSLWEHASQHPGTPLRHERRVEAGRCLTWTTTWWNRTDEGADLAPGSYSLRLSVRADDVGAPNGVLTQDYRYVVEEG